MSDLVIIGSGPAGYTAALYAARAGLDPTVLTGTISAGGALMTTTTIENFPGFPDGVQGPELMQALRDQAVKFGANLVMDDVVSVDLTGPVKVVTDSDARRYEAAAVIVATGSDYKKLGLADEARLSGRGVSWCATCDGFFFRGKDIGVVGGGDSAIEEALFLTRFANSVTLIHRRDQLRASRIMRDRAMANPKIRFAWNQVVSAIHGDTAVSGVELTNTTTGATTALPLEGLFIAIGQVPRSELVADQVALDEDGFIVTDGLNTATNQPGVFACGDVVDRVYRQAITAAAAGCRAALDAQHFLASREEPGAISGLTSPA